MEFDDGIHFFDETAVIEDKNFLLVKLPPNGDLSNSKYVKLGPWGEDSEGTDPDDLFDLTLYFLENLK